MRMRAISYNDPSYEAGYYDVPPETGGFFREAAAEKSAMQIQGLE